MLRQSPFDCRGGALQPAESTAGDRRIDSDGQAYTWQQFAATYGPDAPRFWDAAFHRSALRTAFDGKSYTFLQYLERYGDDAQRFWDNAEKVVVNASAEPKKDEENAAANHMPPIPQDAAVDHAQTADAQRFRDDASQLAVDANGEPEKDEEDAAANHMPPIPEDATVNHVQTQDPWAIEFWRRHTDPHFVRRGDWRPPVEDPAEDAQEEAREARLSNRGTDGMPYFPWKPSTRQPWDNTSRSWWEDGWWPWMGDDSDASQLAIVCGLFNCEKIYDAAKQEFNGFCSKDCENFYKETLSGRSPLCGNLLCEQFAQPPFLPFCSKECTPDPPKSSSVPPPPRPQNPKVPPPPPPSALTKEMEQLAPTPQVQPQRPHGTHRIAADNFPYTWLEFQDYYGQEAAAVWDNAPEAPDGGASHGDASQLAVNAPSDGQPQPHENAAAAGLA